MSRARITLLALALVVMGGTSCSTPTHAPRSAPVSDSSTTTADRPLVLDAGQVDHRVGTSFQYQSFLVTIGHAVYDQTRHQLIVGIGFRNLSEGWAQAEVAGTLVLADGHEVAFSGTPFRIPPGASADLTGSSSSLPSDPVPTASLRWGYASFDQPVVRLDGHGGPNRWLPTPIHLDGWAHVGPFSIHALGATINAGLLDQDIQAPPGHRILRVVVDSFMTTGSINPFAPRDHLQLRLPDGTVVEPLDSSPLRGRLSWTQKENEWADFPIPTKVAGRYELLLAAMPRIGFGTIRPELIEHRPIPFAIGATTSTPLPSSPLAVPDLTPPGEPATGSAVDRTLDVGDINVPGYLVRPTHISWDPQTNQIRLDASVTSLAALGPGGAASLATKAGLSTPPQFGFTEALLVDGVPRVGNVSGSTQVDPAHPTLITFTFPGVSNFDPDRATLLIGPADGAVSRLPLGPDAPGDAAPPAIRTLTMSGPPLVAGNWTVSLKAARLGRLLPSVTPRPGMQDLEITMDVTSAASAKKNSFGLSFNPRYQLLRAGPSGYDTEPVAGTDYVQQEPGTTVRTTVTFEVPDTFTGGTLGFVARSLDEVGDLGTSWVESRGLVTVGATTDAAVLGGTPS